MTESRCTLTSIRGVPSSVAFRAASVLLQRLLKLRERPSEVRRGKGELDILA